MTGALPSLLGFLRGHEAVAVGLSGWGPAGGVILSNAEVVSLDFVKGFHSSCGIRHSLGWGWGAGNREISLSPRVLGLERERQRFPVSWEIGVTKVRAALMVR